MKLRLKELSFVPAAMMACFVIRSAITFDVLESAMFSYATLGLIFLSFILACFFLFNEPLLSRFDLLAVLLLVSVGIVSMIDAVDWVHWIYISLSVGLVSILFHYNREHLNPLVVGALVGFSFCVYAGFLHTASNPHLWLIGDAKNATGYLLGDNYNQIGCRVLCAFATNIVCLRISKWFWVNFVFLILAGVGQLLMVGSMTSTMGVVLFLLLCCIPSKRLQRIGAWSVLTIVVLFQVFVCFNGKGLENNEFANWLVVDVLGKDLSFTYRTDMWDSALRIIVKSPLWGYGYVSSDWYVENMSSFAIGPHNMIFAVMIYGGVIGLAIYLALWGVSLNKLLSNSQSRLSNMLFSLIAVFMVMMLMEYYPIVLIVYVIFLTYYFPNIEEQNKGAKIDEH